MSRLLSTSRYLVLLAVAGCFLGAAALFVYGLLAVVRVVVATLAVDVAHLVRVIVLLVGVTFLGSFVEQADDVPLWDLSAATALGVVAFSLVILVGKLPDWSRAKEADGVGRHSEDATASDRA
jgi:hypothetical protein